MPDRDDRLLDLDDDVDAYEDDWEPAPEERALPPRRRRRLVTPASAVLAAVLIAALGFIGGVEVQKGQADGGGGAATAGGAGRPGRAGRRRRRGRCGPGGFAGPGGAQGNATIGSVVNKRGSTLYVKDSDGTTIRVKTTSHSKINRTATRQRAARSIPATPSIVQGTKSSSGTITATQINATSSSAASGLAGLFGGGGGFGGPAAAVRWRQWRRRCRWPGGGARAALRRSRRAAEPHRRRLSASW